MQIRKILGLMMAFMLNSLLVNAASINMVSDEPPQPEPADNLDFAVNINDLHYTVTVSDGLVQRIELNGNSNTEFTVNTDWDTVWTFVESYNQMTWLDKVRFLITEFKIPAEYILKID